MNTNNHLKPKDYLDATIEAGIGAIPIIGGPIQTVYFGLQNEKRFKRIEAFYKQLNQEMETVKSLIPSSINKESQDQLLATIETINFEVEQIKNRDKIIYFVTSFKNLLLSVDQNNLDTEEYFVDILSSLRKVDLDVLIYLFRRPEVKSHGGISVPIVGDLDRNMVSGILNRLVDFSLVRRNLMAMTIGGSGGDSSNYTYYISDYGVNFCRYILETKKG